MSSSPEETVLPLLASRAQAKIDRLSFREPGDESARKRMERLKSEIAKLDDEERSLKRKLEDIRNGYLSRPEVEEVERLLIRINMKMKDTKNEAQKQCDRVGKQVDETKRALIQALVPRIVMDSDSRRTSKDLKKKKKDLDQLQRDDEFEKLRMMIFDRELPYLNIEIKRLQERQQNLEKHVASLIDKDGHDTGSQASDTTDGDSTTDSSSDSSSDSSEEGSEAEHHLAREIQIQTLDIAAKGGSLEVTINEDIESTTKQESPNPKATSPVAELGTVTGTDVPQSLEADTIGPLAQRQNSQVSDNAEFENNNDNFNISTGVAQNVEADGEDKDQGKEPNQRDTDASSNVGSTSGVGPHQNSEDSRETIQKASKNEKKRHDRINRRREKARKELKLKIEDLEGLKRDIEYLEEQVSNKRTERDKCIEKRNHLQKEIGESKGKVDAMTSEEKERGRHGAENEKDQQWQKKKIDEWKLQLQDLERQRSRESALEEVRKESNRRRSRLRLRHYWEDSESEGEGNSDDNHVESIRKVIDGVEALEDQIRNVRNLNEKVDSVVDLRTVLKRELDLETSWLDTRDNATPSISRDYSLARETRDHFSSSIPPEFKLYEPLEEGQVRLLVVWPAPADHYPLLCTLETSRLSEGASRRKYAALSYFWGSDLCNGRLYLVQNNAARNAEKDTMGSTARYAMRIPIRNNLFRALLRLRRSDSAVSLWVDVMCINQNDVAEKTEQLEQLIKIYQNAENVCIWLGESDNKGRSEEAMKFIPAIMDFAVLDRYAQDPKQAEKWYGLAELMRDRWFSRRWVVQEISLARQATIHCGGIVVQWPDFADAVSLLVSNQETIKKLFDYSKYRDGPNTLGDVQSFGAHILLEATSKLFLRTARGEITRPVKKLESLVTSLKTFDVTDSKDLIYSLVCIASDTPQGQKIYPGKQDSTVPLDVNYAKSPVRVYKDFINFCIMSSKSLDILCRPWAMPPNGTASSENEAINLPSWIPLLSQSEFGIPEEVYSGRKNGENLVGAVGRPHYKASAGQVYDDKPLDERQDDLPFLPVTGFKLAKIGKVSSRITGGVILRDSLKMGGWTGINKDTAGVPDKIWRTLVADRDPDGQIPPTWYQRACMRCLELADTFNNGDLNIGELLTGNSELIRKYLTRVRHITWNRRFFEASMKNESHGMKAAQTPNMIPAERMFEAQGITRDGYVLNDHQTDRETELFGLGPPDMASGDYVCILIGCSVPVVLREEDGCMKLIGETYVHGKMEGEAMEDLANRTTWDGEETFKLK